MEWIARNDCLFVLVEEDEASISAGFLSRSISSSSEDEDEDEYYYHDNDEDELHSDYPDPFLPIPPFRRKVHRKPSTIFADVNAALATQCRASSSTSVVHAREVRPQNRAPLRRHQHNVHPHPRTPTACLPGDVDLGVGVVAGPDGVVQPDSEMEPPLQTNTRS